MKVLYVFVSLFFGSLAVFAASVQGERANHLVEVREGDTVEGLAQLYLGDAALAGELLRANLLDVGGWGTNRPAVLWVGQGLREEAVGVVARCREALEEARGRQAAVFAVFEYGQAVASLKQAEHALDEGAYGVALEVGLWAANRSREAVLQARTAALVPEEGSLSSVGVGVALSYDGGVSWQDVGEGGQVSAGTLVRNGSGQDLLVSFPAGSSVVLEAGSLFFIDMLQRDERDGRREMRLRLDKGGGLFRAPKGDAVGSRWVLRSGVAQMGGGALLVRCAVEEDEVRWTCLEGGGVLSLATGEVDVLAEHTVWVDGGCGVRGPFARPAVPRLLSPEVGVQMASQLPLLRWEAVEDVLRYRVRLSRVGGDEDAEWSRLVEADMLRVGPLLAGRYSWEVQGINEYGLEGVWSEMGSFDLRLNYDLEMLVEGRYLEQNGVLYSGKGASYTFRAGAEESSVESIEARVGDEPWRVLGGDVARLTFDRSGEFSFAVRGVGLAGESGSATEYRIHVDAEGPRVRVHLSEPLDFPGEGLKAALAVRCDDPAGVKETVLMLDGALYEGGSDFLLLNMSRRHRVKVTSTDGWGNVSVRRIRTYPDGRVKVRRARR